MSLLYWIDKSPSGYWVSAFSIAACLTLLAILPMLPWSLPWARPSSRFGTGRAIEEAAFCVLIFLTIFAFRWVYLFYPRYINPDEAGFVMGALTLKQDLVFWRSISFGTSGPLNGYVLLLPAFLGFEINYSSARTMGLLLASGAVTFLYLTGRNILGSRMARLIALGATAFFALTTEPNFIHLSSEHFPLFLLSAACYFSSSVIWRGEIRVRDLYLAGFMLGAVPFAKLQGVPPAGLLALVVYLFILTRSESWRRRLTLAAYMTAGGATLAAIFLVMTLLGGCFDQALYSYLGTNVEYTDRGGVPFIRMLGLVESFLKKAPTLRPYLLSLSSLAALLSLFGLLRWKNAGRVRWIWALALAHLLGAWSAVILPGRLYEHYLLFLVIPTAFFLQSALALADIAGLDSAPRALGWKLGNAALATLTIAGLILWPVIGGFPGWPRPLGHLETFRTAPPRPVVAAVRSHANEGDLVALWGWMYEVCAESGLGRGTRTGVLERAWIDSDLPGRPKFVTDYRNFVPRYFFDLYLEDMKRNKPALFVDACAPGAFAFKERDLFGYETFPALATYVNAHYELAEEVEKVRIFRRKP